MAAGGTPHTPSILLEQNGELWGGVIGASVLLVLAVAVFGIIIVRRKSRARRKRHVTAGNDRLKKQQRKPLIKSTKLSEYNIMPSSISYSLSLQEMGSLGKWLVC